MRCFDCMFYVFSRIHFVCTLKAHTIKCIFHSALRLFRLERISSGYILCSVVYILCSFESTICTVDIPMHGDLKLKDLEYTKCILLKCNKKHQLIVQIYDIFCLWFCVVCFQMQKDSVQKPNTSY